MTWGRWVFAEVEASRVLFRRAGPTGRSGGQVRRYWRPPCPTKVVVHNVEPPLERKCKFDIDHLTGEATEGLPVRMNDDLLA